MTRHRTVTIDGFKIFYREAGDGGKPAIVLLHGFPTSSHMYRHLIPALADQFHVIAPDCHFYARRVRGATRRGSRTAAAA